MQGQSQLLNARPTRKGLTSSCGAIDIREWYRDGLLGRAFPFTRQLYRGKDSVTRLRIVPSSHRLLATLDQDGLRRTFAIPIEWTSCRFGGNRPWFVCPGESCGRRVAILYASGILACRHCHNLAYPSQLENRYERALRRAGHIHLRLGWNPDDLSALGGRPKGMHKKTYHRLFMQRGILVVRGLKGVLECFDV